MMPVHKKGESALMKVINVLLLIITFGKQNKFMTDYVTTIGDKIYVPDGWMETADAQTVDSVLYHENVHVEQYKKDGFLFYLKYLFYPMPFLHAHARLEYELEAYAKQIVYSYRKYGTPLFGAMFEMVISQMTGPMYFWTCVNKKHVMSRLTARIFAEMKETKPKKDV